MKNAKSFAGLTLALGMILYAVPQLKVGNGWEASSLFSVVWLGFALLVVSAHLYWLLGVNEEKQRGLGKIREFNKQRIRKMMRGRTFLPARGRD